MKARFTTEQPAVSWQPLDNGKVDVTIRLNGQEVTEEITQTVEKEQEVTHTETYWEYDFHQFREKAENISQDKVLSKPENYLDYEPVPEKTLEQTVAEQNEQIRMLTECLMEMSEAVYA